MENFLSISELTFILNKLLEETFCQVNFEGEIHQLTKASSGHIYLTLKDQDSQVQAAMWRSAAQKLQFKPEVGQFVQCIGTANLYNKSGRFQMTLESMSPAGAGKLQKEFLELKAKLEKEGLFSEARKRALPVFPKCVGIVTSETAAALQDMLVKIRERMPSTLVLLSPARVQGEGSVQDICRAIERLNRDQRAEVIIVGRGGGSLEDLWSFNKEEVVRAIFKSDIPIVSAVGHETDITLADLVADVRAPTPTAAAELVVPHRQDLLQNLENYLQRLANYERWFAPLQQSFDDYSSRFLRAYKVLTLQNKLKLEAAFLKLKKIEPHNLLASKNERLLDLERRLKLSFGKNTLKEHAKQLADFQARINKAFTQHLNLRSQKIKFLEQQLSALSYQRILDRGFSLIYSKDKLVNSSSDLTIKQEVELRFAKGSALAEIKKI
jgi:exodeoxyribonuclease VII large subunit